MNSDKPTQTPEASFTPHANPLDLLPRTELSCRFFTFTGAAAPVPPTNPNDAVAPPATLPTQNSKQSLL
jgi:hypothetical protein